jgi:predicted ArsR family transcriptional regulator
MLEQLIAEIRAGGTLETGALAERLGTSPQMVQAMLEHLQISGHIQAYSNCGDGCRGCDLKSACGAGRSIGTVRLWQSSDE